MNKYALVAELKNRKKVLVEPNHKNMSCAYRYLSDKEMADDTLYMDKKYIWYETPIHQTIEDGKHIFFSIIEVTPIVLARI